MSRTVGQFNCNNPQDSEIVIQKILSLRGYQRTEQNGEIFYQNGSSLFTPPKCIKYTFNGQILTLEGWVVPFNRGSESELKGISCSASKKECMNVLKEIQNHLNISLIDNPNLTMITPQDGDSENHYIELGVGVVIALFSPALGFLASLYFFIRGYEKSNRHGLIVVAVSAANWGLAMLFHALRIF